MVTMITLGIAIYASGHRTRKSLDAPILSNHSKLFLGGSLAFFGLGLLAVAMMHAR